MTRRYPWKKHRPAAPAPPPSSFVRGEHEFRIVGFSAAGDAHYSVLSGAFQVGGHTWALEFGFDELGHLTSVFLELLTPYVVTGDLVVAKAGLRIEDPLGRCPAAEWRSEDAHTFTVSSGENGNRSWKLSVPDEFRAHEDRYVHHDRLTILCTLEVLQEDDHDSAVADDIHKLLSLPSELHKSKSESDRRRHACMLPDVTFVVEETEIQAHRLVLAARSPVFAAELLGDMREGTARRVKVDDMRASVFRAMIRFIYTDKMPIKGAKTTDDEASGGSKAKCAARRRVAMACDLLAAADRYDLEKLRVMCEEILSEAMDVTSVMPTLMAVHGRESCRRLEASCIEYLASDADVYAAVKATDDYMELQESFNSFLVEVMDDKVTTRKSAVISSSFDPDTATKTQQRSNNLSVSTYDTSKVVSRTHEMRIPNFGVVKILTGIIEVDSDTFQAHGYEWKLLVYPHSYTAAEEKHVYVYIELLTDPGTAGVRASGCLRMDDPTGDSAPTQANFLHIFTRKAPTLGYHFTTMKYAKEHYLAHDGSLTVQCDIAVTNMTCIPTSVTSAGFTDTTLAPPANIARHLEELLASEKGLDVTFLVEKREIHAHKLVIAARSPVLYEVVGAANTENGIIPVDDIKVKAFEAMLHFIYTGELPPMEGMGLASEDGVLIIGDMLAAACRFGLDMMKAKCETLLAESISKENASNTLELARRHGFLKLEDYCDQFISSEYVARYISDMRNKKLIAWSRRK